MDQRTFHSGAFIWPGIHFFSAQCALRLPYFSLVSSFSVASSLSSFFQLKQVTRFSCMNLCRERENLFPLFLMLSAHDCRPHFDSSVGWHKRNSVYTISPRTQLYIFTGSSSVQLCDSANLLVLCVNFLLTVAVTLTFSSTEK